MNTVITKLETLKSKTDSYWGKRIISQLEYASLLSKVKGGKYDSLIKEAVNFIDSRFAEDAAITKQTAKEAENLISSLSEEAKSFKMICVAHAHLDMNWMWGFAETVAITLDTFRTMLDLMKEYPYFKFSQSQASVYRIVEEYAPAMLDEIKQRIKEGRWEVTASTWVEGDKNMPTGESLSRHILYTKRYLSKLLDISPESLKIDFEPDTFGHNRNVPEILSKGGVKFYYHCRGFDGHNIYKWKAPSGSSILVYRDPFWYNDQIDSSIAMYVPEFCDKNGIDTMIKVYGVGDHGGGPTRRDIERIIDMASWPVFPSIRFGTFLEFFETLEKSSARFPVVEQELNFIFTGCYTSQSRIKMSNRIGEARLNEAELFSAFSALLANGTYRGESFAKAWEKVLFNHFHDILPGSCIIDSREYALGEFQKVLATANTENSAAFRNIASKIDTSMFTLPEEDVSESMSEGAGVGYAVKDFGVPQAERGKGKLRIFHLFNPSPHERRELVEIIVWDWPGDKERIVIKDAAGNEVKFQVLSNENIPFFDESYWGHTYMKLLVDAKVPPCGYSTYTLSERELDELSILLPSDSRVEEEDKFVLENDLVKVDFDTRSASIISIIDKSSGKELIDAGRHAGLFRLAFEDVRKGMTAWITGRHMNVCNLNLNENVRIKDAYMDKSSLRQWISYEIKFNKSRINMTISLDYNSSRLNCDVECDWKEEAKRGEYVPQLNFYMPLNYSCKAYRYDIPFGVIEREGMDRDVPANSWILGVPSDDEAKAVMLITNTKYGFRGMGDSLAVTLVRSSYEPDPYPEYGIQKYKFAIDIVDNTKAKALIERAYDYNHPLRFISGTVHKGSLPLESSFMSMESGHAIISAVKMPENDVTGKSLIIRVYEAEGKKSQAVIRFATEVSRAWFVDINEKPVELCSSLSVDGNKVAFETEPYSITSICVEFSH